MSRSKKPPTPAASQRQASRYDHRQAGKNAVARRVSAAGREVGEIPPVANASANTRTSTNNTTTNNTSTSANASRARTGGKRSLAEQA